MLRSAVGLWNSAEKPRIRSAPTSFNSHFTRLYNLGDLSAKVCIVDYMQATDSLTDVAGQTILIVDDSPMVLDVIRSLLAGAGHSVLMASSAEEALLLLSEPTVQVALVVSDMRLGDGKSGLELLQLAMAGRPELKGMLISGALDFRRPAGSAIAVLPKPFNADAFLARVASLLDREAV